MDNTKKSTPKNALNNCILFLKTITCILGIVAVASKIVDWYTITFAAIASFIAFQTFFLDSLDYKFFISKNFNKYLSHAVYVQIAFLITELLFYTIARHLKILTDPSVKFIIVLIWFVLMNFNIHYIFIYFIHGYIMKKTNVQDKLHR